MSARARPARAAGRRARAHDAIPRAGAFAVNVRSEGQAEIANRFAGRRPDLPDPFAGLEVVAAPSGAPVFAGAMGYLDCLLTDRLAGGDHSIFVGRVEHAEAFEPGLRSPLLFYDGGFRRVAAG